MFSRSPKRCFWTLLLVFLAGCTYPVRHEVDDLLCKQAVHHIDLEPLPTVDSVPSYPPAKVEEDGKDGKKPPSMVERLEPKGVPGSEAPKFKLPSPEKKEELKKALDRYF